MTMFDERELELIVCGLGEIDVEDWCNNTDYRHCGAADQVVSGCFEAGLVAGWSLLFRFGKCVVRSYRVFLVSSDRWSGSGLS